MLGHRTTLSEFKSIEIIHSMFSDHNGVILEINSRGNFRNSQNVEVKQHTLSSQWVKEEITRELRKYLR